MKRKKKKIYGAKDRPRLSVYSSLKHIYAQLINDDERKTLVSASTLDPEIKKKIKSGGNVEAAKLVGEEIAKKAIASGVKKVVFDRKRRAYHGRLQALAEAARSQGLEF